MIPGEIGFTIGQYGMSLGREAILRAADSSLTLDFTSILTLAWQWLALLALAFWLGILVTEGVVLAGLQRASTLLARARRRARPLCWLCLASILVSDILVLIVQAAQTTHSQDASALIHILTASTYGALWIARVGLLIIAAGLLLATRHRRRAPPALMMVLLTLTGLILLARALSIDAIEPGVPQVGAVVLVWLFQAAQLAWVGCVAYLAFVLLSLLPTVEQERSTETLIELLRRFYPLLLALACVLLVSDFYLTETFPGTVQQFVTSVYGVISLAQWMLVAGTLAVGGVALLALRPRLSRQAALLPVVNAELPARRVRRSVLEQTARGIRRAFLLSACLGAGVLLCTTLLAFVAR